jgi:uncharacterized membrane protein
MHRSISVIYAAKPGKPIKEAKNYVRTNYFESLQTLLVLRNVAITLPSPILMVQYALLVSNIQVVMHGT